MKVCDFWLQGHMWTFYSLAAAFTKHSKWRMLAYLWRMFYDVRPLCLMCCLCIIRIMKVGLTAKCPTAKVLWIVSFDKIIMLIQNMHLYQGAT